MAQAASAVIEREAKPGLVPTAIIDAQLERTLDELYDDLKAERNAAFRALLCGLYLCNGSLDKSHALAQDIADATGSYWHGIMHRMEPDYDNARYWFRRTGRHPVFGPLHQRVSQFLAQREASPPLDARLAACLSQLADRSEWDPFLWIEIVAGQAGGEFGRDGLPVVLHIQWIELRELLDYAYRSCFGGSLLDR